MPDGKVIVVTGATSGLGQAAAVDFAKGGARVILVGRDAARAEETRQVGGGDTEVVLGDVSTRAGIREVAAGIRALTDRIDVLVNNAGGTFDTMQKSADGFERSFALNTFGPYLLEKELHPLLAAARGRVVNVATGFLDWYPLDVDQLVSPAKYNGMNQYAHTKHALVMLTVEQAARFAPDGVTAVSMTPGIVMGTRFGGGQSAMAQAIGGPFMRLVGMAATLEEGVRRIRAAAFDDVPSGTYMYKGAPSRLPKQAADPAVRARVVQLLDSLVTAGSP